jgi:hypothetical protein
MKLCAAAVRMVHPHPNPLPHAGAGVASIHLSAGNERREYPLFPGNGGEGWGEGMDVPSSSLVASETPR